jgi:RNA polymerase sigma-54 factor
MENNKTPSARSGGFNLNPELSQRLEQRLSPQMIQSMEILQLQSLDLQLLIKQEMEINPTLELAEEQELIQDKTDDRDKDDNTDDEKTAPESDPVEILDKDRETIHAERSPKQQLTTDRKWEAMQNVSDKPVSLRDYIHQQFKLMETDEKTKQIAEYIIFNIDDNGYIKLSEEEIAQATQSTADEVKKVLSIIQQFDPPGVGARTLQECLILQLSEHDSNIEIKKQIIANHLEDIQMNRIPLVVNILGKPLDDVQTVVSEILQLNPYPGKNFSRESTYHIVPDVFITAIDDRGDYEIRLNNDYVPPLRINQYYQKMLADPATPQETKDYIKKKIESANAIVLAIRQRQNTLLRISKEIVNAQKEFFDKGMSYLKPLKMQDIADKLKIHITTVSRAISSKQYKRTDEPKNDDTTKQAKASKYIQTPRGIFSMKFFFSRSTDSSINEWQSVKSVLSMLQELINQENKESPLSDAEIIKNLSEKGVKVARRTVTKYRQMLNIPSSQARKKY